MKKFLPSFLLLALTAGSGVANARNNNQIPADSVMSRVHVVTGNSAIAAHRENIMVMNMAFNPAFEDPSAPRFLFLDREGKVALGIGGTVKAEAMYDMNGAINNNSFVTSQIPVPFNPAQRNRFGATATHSGIFLKLVTQPTRIGRIIVYVQSEFTGDDGAYGFQLKQAYVQVGHLTLGKARSTFSDGPAMAPTIDDQGPSGQVTAKNMLVQYATSNYSGFTAAIAAELPSATYTEGTATSSIAQRFPDIPVYAQYAWNSGESHARISGILRQLSYRDDAAAANHFVTGWGVQFSLVSKIAGGLDIFGHYTYGKGIGSYINDLAGDGFDLIADANNPGKLVAPGSAGYTAGLQYTFSPRFFMTGSYSHAQLYDAGHLGGDTYRSGQYIDFNAFYNVWDGLRVGLEYIHGNRTDYNGQTGRANRLLAMLQYNF